jgi:hypothetical protein
MKRLKAHELLEKETIKASALRHKLAHLPHKLKAELTGLYVLSNKRTQHTAVVKPAWSSGFISGGALPPPP